jgi:DNA-binding response OmpR family regulator
MTRLLVVEDDERVARFLDRGLRAEGYQVQMARTGTQALEVVTAAKAEPFELMLLDIMLPERSGLEVCQALRAAGNRVPILMLSAMDTLDDKVAGLRLGADDYLTKPFAFDELLARIEALLRRSSNGLAALDIRLLQVADLCLDLDRMQASRAGALLRLTARELALLELLMRHPGRLYSRERILSNVWGVAEDPLTNVVDVYIRRLRSKIDDGQPQALIKTVRGLGYKLDDSPDT